MDHSKYMFLHFYFKIILIVVLGLNKLISAWSVFTYIWNIQSIIFGPSGIRFFGPDSDAPGSNFFDFRIVPNWSLYILDICQNRPWRKSTILDSRFKGAPTLPVTKTRRVSHVGPLALQCSFIWKQQLNAIIRRAPPTLSMWDVSPIFVPRIIMQAFSSNASRPHASNHMPPGSMHRIIDLSASKPSDFDGLLNP